MAKVCTKCELYKNSQQPCIQGVGSRKAKLMLVGMNPIAKEDKTGIPFTDTADAGVELNKALEVAGIKRKDIYITHLGKCCTVKNVPPTKEETEACMPYLIEEIKRIKPNTIILLGNHVSQYLIGLKGVKRHHGKILWNSDLKVKMVITTHPAAICYGDKGAATMLANDLRIAYQDSQLAGFHDTKKKVKYTTCTNMVQVHQLFDKLKKSKRFVIDLETTKKQAYKPDSRILCIGFSWKAGTATVLPMWEWKRDSVWSDEDLETIKYLLAEVLEDERILKILATGKFDIGWLCHLYGIRLAGFAFDTEIAHYLTHNIDKRHGMDTLAYRYTDMGGYKDKLKEDKKEGFRNTDPADIYYYCAQDCDCEYRVCEILEEEMEPYNNVMKNIMLPLSTVLADMELAGIRIDREKVKKLEQKYTPKIAELVKKMKQLPQVKDFAKTRKLLEEEKLTTKYKNSKTLAKRYKSIEEYIKQRAKGFTVNFKSTKQLVEIIYGVDFLNITSIGKTKLGTQASTDSKTLQLLNDRPKSKHMIFDYLLEYRRLTKLLSTYILPMYELSALDGRLHTQFLQTRTSTMRLASKNPNLQNIPRKEAKEIRDCFIASEGHILIDADLKAIEWRWLAHFCNDKQMVKDIKSGIEVTLSSGKTIKVDIHRYLASQVFGKSADEITKLERDKVKTITYGTPYGRGNDAIVKQFNIPLEKVEAVVEALYERYPDLKKWLDAVKEKIHTYKYIKTFFGFRRDIPKIDDPNKYIKAAAEREAIASTIQGSAAGLIFMYTNNTYRRIRREGLKTKILLQIHDNLVLDVPKNEIAQVCKILREELSRPIKGLRIPIQVEITMAERWGSLKEQEVTSMKIRKITMSKGVTLPTDEKFKMARYDVLFEAEIEEGDKVSDVAAKLKKGIDALLRKNANEDGLTDYLGSLA